MNPRRRRDIYSNLLIIAIAALIAAWMSFAWTFTTGLTFTTRSSRGRIATEADSNRSKHIAVLTTIVAGPMAWWSALKRKQYK